MKQLVLIALIGSFGFCFAQENKTFKDYFNEFHISINHGVPLNANDRAFFGGGLGMSHVFRIDKVVGARTGLELDCFHVQIGNSGTPESDETRQNQHFYITSLGLPINLRLSFGKKTHFLFELGSRFGLVVSGYYTADVLRIGPNYETYFERVKTNKGPVGLGTIGFNTGIGSLIPLSEKLALLIKPDFGANLFFFDNPGLHFYGRLCVGIHLK
jgi:hypothetical protein